MGPEPEKTGDEGSALGSIHDIITRLKGIVHSNLSPEAMIETVAKVDEGAHEVIKTFGQGREMILGLKATMTGAVDAVKLLGGEFIDIQTIQTGVASTLNRNLVLSKESYEGLYATSQLAGQSADTMISSFKDAGFSAYDAASKMGDVVNIAREVGVNAQDVSSKVILNMDAINKYNFEGGVQGLAKMAAQASMLRIEMRDTLVFTEKVYNPEGAIETAAALQRLGVAQSELLDPLRLMDLSQNDPTELQNQIVQMTQQFVKLNDTGNFEIMKGSKRQFREIAEAMKIPYETLTKMALGSAELDDKMKKIRFPNLDLSEEQRTLIANMAEKKDGTYKIEVGGESKSISQLSKEDVELLKKVGEPKTMEELARDQLTTLEDIEANTKYFEGKLAYTFAGSKVSQGVLEGTRKVTRGITKTVPKELSITELRKSLDSATTEVASIVKGMGTNTMSVSEGVVKLSEVLSKGGTFIETAWKKWSDNFEKSLDSEGINVESIKKLYKNMTDGKVDTPTGSVATSSNAALNKIAENTVPSAKVDDFIVTPNGVIETYEQDTIIGMTKGEELFKGLGNNTNNKDTANTTTSSTINFNLNHTITINNAPSGIDTQQLVLALKNEEIKQSILKSVKDGVTNSGRLTSTSNPQQSMNSLRNSFGVVT
jgi:hypothetical protein